MVWSTTDSLLERRIRYDVNQAITANKIFQVDSFYPMYNFPLLCSELRRRGWRQKFYYPFMNPLKQTLISDHRIAAEMLRNVKPNFIWTFVDYNRQKHQNNPFFNRLIAQQHDSNFTLKTGLARIYQRIYWFDFSAQYDYILPRCYPIRDLAERAAFTEDYELTICLSFLYELSTRADVEQAFSEKGNQSIECFQFACDFVQRAIVKKQHNDIDDQNDSPQPAPIYRNFKDNYLSVLAGGQTIKIQSSEDAQKYVAQLQTLIRAATEYFPLMRYDGFHNVWIVKPANWDGGKGIRLFDNNLNIFKYINSQPPGISWVVQKYIERPLLVYNTKFDFRQYFLITMANDCENLWMYKNSYFRFSGHEFSLDKLTSQIHLTNYAVQRRHANGPRSPHLPRYNGWTLKDFLNYLARIQQLPMWSNRIYPGMVNCIKSVVHASLDETEYSRNNYQLYGADFMITDDFYPILIEINPGPHLTLTNPATNIVNTNVVRDLLKVVLDYPNFHKCNTGDFELVWKISKLPNYQNYSDNFHIKSTKSLGLEELYQNDNIVEKNASVSVLQGKSLEPTLTLSSAGSTANPASNGTAIPKPNNSPQTVSVPNPLTNQKPASVVSKFWKGVQQAMVKNPTQVVPKPAALNVSKRGAKKNSTKTFFGRIFRTGAKTQAPSLDNYSQKSKTKSVSTSSTLSKSAHLSKKSSQTIKTSNNNLFFSNPAALSNRSSVMLPSNKFIYNNAPHKKYGSSSSTVSTKSRLDSLNNSINHVKSHAGALTAAASKSAPPTTRSSPQNTSVKKYIAIAPNTKSKQLTNSSKPKTLTLIMGQRRNEGARISSQQLKPTKTPQKQVVPFRSPSGILPKPQISRNQLPHSNSMSNSQSTSRKLTQQQLLALIYASGQRNSINEKMARMSSSNKMINSTNNYGKFRNSGNRIK